jgi:hypothetical protein
MFVSFKLQYANTWTEEKKKYGATDTKDTKSILKGLTKRRIFPGLFSHARLYKTFSDKMRKHVVQNSVANVNRVKAQLLKKFNHPSIVNAMRNHLPKSNMGIKSQYQRNMENRFKEKAMLYLNNTKNINSKSPRDLKNLTEKYKGVLDHIDMYWSNMTANEQKMALKSGISFYRTRLRRLK